MKFSSKVRHLQVLDGGLLRQGRPQVELLRDGAFLGRLGQVEVRDLLGDGVGDGLLGGDNVRGLENREKLL
jgi:hypothetical protein